MKIIPSVDLLDQKVVRLHKGNYSEVTLYNDNAVEQLERYIKAGFNRLHVVDLNGAKSGQFEHLSTVRELTSLYKVDIQFGGGIRSVGDIEKVFESGVRYAVATSMAVKNPDSWETAVRSFGADRFICGLDLKNGKIAYSGWTETADVDTHTFISTQQALGITNFLCTDVSKDGTLSGANALLYKDLKRSYPWANWIASGGFSGKAEIPALKDAGCFGVIVGKAYFEKRISLEEMRFYHED